MHSMANARGLCASASIIQRRSSTRRPRWHTRGHKSSCTGRFPPCARLLRPSTGNTAVESRRRTTLILDRSNTGGSGNDDIVREVDEDADIDDAVNDAQFRFEFARVIDRSEVAIENTVTVIGRERFGAAA